MKRSLLIIAITLFGVLTATALWQSGGNFVDWHVKSFGGVQVLADLVIALTLAMVWMWRDAKAVGRNVWPWIALTFATGSFGPLIYLLTRKSTTNIL
jgi:hypothetical protein